MTSGRERAKASPRRRVVSYLVLLFAALCTLGMGFPSSACAQEEGMDGIKILIYNYVEVPPRVLAGAEHEADRILHEAGVRIVWVDCTERPPTATDEITCKAGWGYRDLGLRLLSRHVTNRFQDFTYGFAMAPSLASVYYGDAVLLTDRAGMGSELPALLGCLVAHEVGHLLLDSSNHSSAGIMQGQWGPKQIRQTFTGFMGFTPEQAKLIRLAVKSRMRLPPDGPTYAASSR